MESSLLFIYVIIGLALIFDFINGFHDAANSIATVVSTRVLSPRWAVLWAAAFNFIAFLFFETKVASTIGKGTIDPNIVDAPIIFAALMGAIVWNLITWYYGIPSSSSHALVGGLVGAALIKGGLDALHFGGIGKICAYIVLSPLLGMLAGMVLMYFTSLSLFKSHPRKLDAIFRKLQLVSAALYSLGHGGNDAQKTMGIITLLLYSNGLLKGNFHVPLWVVLVCHVAMGLGTLMGGWRIVETMGMKITKLRPVGGFCAESAGALTLFFATAQGIPVSTTHTITGAIVGVGSVNSISTIRWGIAGRIIWAWILTIPAAAAIAALSWWLVTFKA
jgi:inorganic phosphate transporter, PiT family